MGHMSRTYVPDYFYTVPSHLPERTQRFLMRPKWTQIDQKSFVLQLYLHWSYYDNFTLNPVLKLMFEKVENRYFITIVVPIATYRAFPTELKNSRPCQPLLFKPWYNIKTYFTICWDVSQTLWNSIIYPKIYHI